ncbi:zinc finger MYM-type protein 1-like, partial [Myzus persicae]|uniref:zinc finger MYM-type protein 1-like n=1 Tax=Myzus persicae TaxID=13164 RepID=UPI000B9399E2
MDINKSITTKGGAAKEREKKRIKLNVAAKSCQNIQHFFMPINKINEHDIDDPASVSNLILKHNSENQINDECDNTSQEKEPNLKVVTSSDTQVIECENTSQEDYMTNLEVITSSDAQVTVSSIDIHDPIHPSSLTHLNLKERILKGGYKPILSLYPRKLQGNKFRSFHKEWYKQYDWLEYSPTADAAFCFPCRMFKGNEKNCGQIDSTFFEKGFSAWYRAGEAFKKHQLSKYHLNSSTALHNYIHNKSIASKIDERHAYETSQKEIERQNNRLTMNRLIDIVICLVKGGRPFRGHNESSHSVNQGLFKELVNLLSKYDTVLKKHLIEGPKHALYTKKNRPIETLVSLQRLKSTTAQDIFNSLCSVLDLMNKQWEDVLSVCFDGASTMSGHLNGVQSKCKEKNNSIMYVHCYAHCLNLVLVDSICEKSNSKGKQNRLVFNFLGTVQFIYNFIESSPMRHATLEKVAKETGDKLHTLKSCSNTRWACRAEAVKAIMNNYEVLIIAIENICENCSVPEMRAKGIGLLYQLKTFDFIFGMHMMNPILMLILKVSTLLQEPNLNLVLAMKNVNSLRSTLDSMRNDDSEYKQMFDRSVILCKKHDIVIPD